MTLFVSCLAAQDLALEHWRQDEPPDHPFEFEELEPVFAGVCRRQLYGTGMHAAGTNHSGG